MSYILYHTLGCHLCEIAENVLSNVNLTLTSEQQIRYTKIDIADDAQLTERYGISIPVLACEMTKQELNWPFDEQDVLRLLNG